MKLNLNRLRKDEILWLNNHYCRHGHSYLEHQNCIEVEKPNMCPISEKVGFLDIETTGLQATYAYVNSYAIKELNGKMIGRALTPKEILNGKYDKELLKECVADMRKFDKLITYYGGDYRFDLPILRTRSIYWGIDFPLYKEIKVIDLYSIVKKKLNLHSKRLGVVCDFFGIPSKEHKMSPKVWSAAHIGQKWALNWIWKHNQEDCISTEKLYLKMIDFVGRQNTSI